MPREPIGVLLLLLLYLFYFIFVVCFSLKRASLIGEEEVQAVWDSTHKGGFAGQANMGIVSILGLKSHFNSLKSPINCKA